MSDLVVIVPSRGRPQNIDRLFNGFENTDGFEHSDLLLVLDDDDPTLQGYYALLPYEHVNYSCGDHVGLAGCLNDAAVEAAGRYQYVGFMGDDHLPRTEGWDKIIVNTLAELGTGIVYGNDLFQGERLPTAVFMTSDIVRTLGYMCFPGARHMFLDDCWKAWGEGIGRLRYLPDVIIEHLHPAAQKAAHDDRYQETDQLMGPDSVAWADYRQSGGLGADVEKLRALL